MPIAEILCQCLPLRVADPCSWGRLNQKTFRFGLTQPAGYEEMIRLGHLFCPMPKASNRNGNSPRTGTTKYDAHHKVLSQTYGAFADLRRELSDSKTTVNEREDLLRSFATCPDSQRAWLLLEDYFEKLLLSRKDFPDTNWWPRLLNARFSPAAVRRRIICLCVARWIV